MMRVLLRSLIGCMLLCATAALPPAFAQDDPAPLAPGLEGDEGFQKLAAASDFLKAAESLRFVASSFFDGQSQSGVRLKRFATHEVVVRRPNELAFVTIFDDGFERRGWFSGSELVVATPAAETYIRLPFEGSVDALLDHVSDTYDISVPFADFVRSDIIAAQRPYLLSIEDAGTRRVANMSVDHIVGESIAADFQIWIQTGDTPLPVRFVATYVREPGDPDYMLTFLEWDLNAATDENFEVELGENWVEGELPDLE